MRWLALMLMLSSGLLPAADIHVGKDAKTINEAIKLAKPGDTIHLEPRVYREYAGFYGKQGLPGAPITLDGRGAILEGSDPLNPSQWTEVSTGLFKCDNLLPRLDDAILGRWFFLWNGQMNRMGRTSKGRTVPFMKVEDLKPGGWTFVRSGPDADASKQVHGSFYLKLEPGQKLAEAGISVPVRSAGVQFSGKSAHLVIRNITATHPYNDGFNIHGDCRDVVFENIRAIECGDDGISAHESAQYSVRGLVSVGNSTGICDTGTAQTSYDQVFISRCVGYDLYFLDEGTYTLRNAVIKSSAQNAVTITGRDTGTCRMTMENVLIQRRVQPNLGNVARNAILNASRCTFENFELKGTGGINLTNCFVNGKAVGTQNGQAGIDRSNLPRTTVE